MLNRSGISQHETLCSGCDMLAIYSLLTVGILQKTYINNIRKLSNKSQIEEKGIHICE